MNCGICLTYMQANIATHEQVEMIIEKHFHDTTSFNAPAGIRTLSPLEKIYDTMASGNLSSWPGPVWIIVNFLALNMAAWLDNKPVIPEF